MPSPPSRQQKSPWVRALLALVLPVMGSGLLGCAHTLYADEVHGARHAPSSASSSTTVATRTWRLESSDELAELRKREESMFPRRRHSRAPDRGQLGGSDLAPQPAWQGRRAPDDLPPELRSPGPAPEPEPGDATQRPPDWVARMV